MKPVSTSDLVKVRLSYYSDVLDSDTVEYKNATVVDEANGVCRLASIPHYGAPVSLDDTIRTVQDPETGDLVYQSTLQDSGNSTVQIVILADTVVVEDLSAPFEELGCDTEKVNDQYFVMNIPATMEYAGIRDTLQDMEDAGAISYAEPWLAPGHQAEE